MRDIFHEYIRIKNGCDGENMGSTQNFNKKRPEVERLHINLARLKKGGRKFEVVVDPDNAVAFREGKLKDILEVLIAQRIFEDVQKGVFSPKMDLDMAFPNLSTLQIAEIIVSKGELQLSAKYRDAKQEEKRRIIIEAIHRNSINPSNNLPHPLTRIKNAFDEARIKIDDSKSAHDQVQDIVKKLQPILPIKFEHKHIQVHISEKYAKKHYKIIHKFGRLLNEKWLDDGCYMCTVEVPAGLYLDFIEDLNKKTHGGVEIKLLTTKNGKFYE
ncbi:MAG: ribosome assembly factor SBDS [Candidatus Woesearchaeota archaeon]